MTFVVSLVNRLAGSYFVVDIIPMTRLYGLDAMRGIAALIVAMGHADYLTESEWLFTASYLAVDFFFMLSGYILARNYEPKLVTGLTPPAFVFARLKRLWPTMAIGAMIGFFSFVQVFQPSFTVVSLIMALTFIPLMLPPGAVFPINPPSWSILAELVANSIHGVFLVKFRAVGLALVAGISLAVLIANSDDLNVGPLPEDLWLGFFRVGLSYSIGILIWRIAGDQQRLPLWPAILALPCSIVLAAFIADWFDFVFAVAICPLIVLGGISARFRWLGSVLGAISFPLYAVHYPIERAIIDNGGSRFVAIAAAIAVAALIAWLMERHMHSKANQPPAVVSDPVLTRACNSK